MGTQPRSTPGATPGRGGARGAAAAPGQCASRSSARSGWRSWARYRRRERADRRSELTRWPRPGHRVLATRGGKNSRPERDGERHRSARRSAESVGADIRRTRRGRSPVGAASQFHPGGDPYQPRCWARSHRAPSFWMRRGSAGAARIRKEPGNTRPGGIRRSTGCAGGGSAIPVAFQRTRRVRSRGVWVARS